MSYPRGFKADCPGGTLSKEKILEMYALILPTGNAEVLGAGIIEGSLNNRIFFFNFFIIGRYTTKAFFSLH